MNVARFLEANPGVAFDHVEYLRSTMFAERLERRMAAFVGTLQGGRIDVVPPPPPSAPITSGADLPSLDDLDVDGHRVLYKKRSTGTTGKRKTIYYSEAFYFDELFLPIQKVAFVWGVDCYANGVTSASLSNGRAWEHLLLVDPTGASGGMLRLKIDERSVASLSETVRYLARVQPLLVFGKPAVLAALATFLLQRGLQGAVRPAVAISSGGALSGATRALMAEALDCRIGEVYATSEAGCVAIACGEERPYHVDETQTYVECGEQTAGRVLTTMAANEVMPLRRFDTRDTAVWAGGACPCGRPGPRLAELHGKASELLDFGDCRYLDLGRVNLDVLPGASEYRIDATPTAIKVTARLDGPDESRSRAADFVRVASDRIHNLMPRDMRRTPAVLVEVATSPGPDWAHEIDVTA